MHKNLPEFCYANLPSDNSCILIKRGENGYYPVKFDADMYGASEAEVDAMNQSLEVTKAQKQAMIAGSMFGWDVPASNPDMYDEHGEPITASKK